LVSRNGEDAPKNCFIVSLDGNPYRTKSLTETSNQDSLESSPNQDTEDDSQHKEQDDERNLPVQIAFEL
jgi:hypothetical protein